MQLRIATDEALADGVDGDGEFFRYFETDGPLRAGDVAGSLGCPGMTLAQDEVVYDADFVFGARESFDLFDEPGGGGSPALRLYSDQ